MPIQKYFAIMAILSTTLSAGAATLIVDNQATNAVDKNPGTQAAPFKTINAAAQVAQAGDTVIVHAGTYRERVSPARGGTDKAPITYKAAPGERVEVKGSEEWSAPWTPDAVHPRVFSSPVALDLFAQIPNPYAIGISIAGADQRIVARPIAADALSKPWPCTLGQVFIQGEPLTQVESLELLQSMEGSWIVSADGKTLQIHLPGVQASDILLPTVEWSVRNRLFAPRRRGLGYIHVQGFTFLHCANQGPFPQGGAVSTRSGLNWIIEENTIRFAKTVGLDVGSETWAGDKLEETDKADQRMIIQAGHIVRNNTISDNGLCGIAGWNSPNICLYNNLLERNNRLHFSSADANWEEWAAIKLHNSNAIIAGNTIRFNEAHGIWIDNGYNLARITGNVLLGNVGSGIMMELGAGTVLIDNNIISHTRSYDGFYDGNAIYAHDASGLTVVHNLLSDNAGAGVLMRTITGRTYDGKLVTTSDTRILNNIFANNQKGAICLPFENPRSSGNRSDNNLFIGEASFRLNKYQDSFKWEDVVAKLREAGLPPGEDTKGDFRAFNLQAWRIATGWDTNSIVVKEGSFSSLPYRMLMRADISEAMVAARFPAVDEMTVDFQGTNMRSDVLLDDLTKMRVHPGPFQNLTAGKRQVSLVPLRYAEPPKNRLSKKQREAGAGEQRMEREQSTIPLSQGKVSVQYSLKSALVEGKATELWSSAKQIQNNPSVTASLVEVVNNPVERLYAQSVSGVSSSPASCLLFKVPEAGQYEIDLAVVLTKRGSASAGYTVATLQLVDGSFRDAKELWKVELNTPEGYRGKELKDRAEVKQVVACPKEASLLLRFQVVAPGPAPAGIATLAVSTFNLSCLK